MWRYQPLLPIDEDPKVGLHTGFTPLVRAKNLGKALGVNKLYIKNDSVNHPTFSFKDRAHYIDLFARLYCLINS